MGRLLVKQAESLGNEDVRQRLDLYRKAIEVNANDRLAKIALTKIIIAGGEDAEAASEIYNPQTDHRRPPRQACMMLAEDAMNNGNPKEVIKNLERIHSLDQQQKIMYCRASLELDATQAQRALEILRSRRANPIDDELKKWQGLLLVKVGTYGEAFDLLKSCLEKDPNDEQSKAAIKKCLKELGRKSEEYRKTLSSDK